MYVKCQLEICGYTLNKNRTWSYGGKKEAYLYR